MRSVLFGIVVLVSLFLSLCTSGCGGCDSSACERTGPPQCIDNPKECK